MSKDETNEVPMENSTEESTNDSNVVQLQFKKKTPFYIIGGILLVALVAGIYFFFNRDYSHYVVDSKTDRADETSMEYFSFQGGFVKYNVDGITYEDKSGTIVWTEAFTMTEPKVVAKGDYVALTDINNNQYTLYSATRKIGTFTTDYPITDIQVAEQGLVTVVLEDEKTNFIVAYDKEGTKCIEIKTTINKNGYPLAIALSEDGTKLVASYVTIEGTQIENSLTFYNFSDVGKNEVDRQVGYKKFDDELIPRIEFISNDEVCAFGNQRMILYSMKQKPKEIMNKKIKEDIKSVFVNAKYFGYTNKNTSVSSGDGEKTDKKESDESVYTLHAFDLKGKEVLTQDIDFNYTKLHTTEEEIVALSGTQCSIYKYNGFVKYQGVFSDGISEFFPTTRNNHYVLITGDSTKMIHLK